MIQSHFLADYIKTFNTNSENVDHPFINDQLRLLGKCNSNIDYDKSVVEFDKSRDYYSLLLLPKTNNNFPIRIDSNSGYIDIFIDDIEVMLQYKFTDNTMLLSFFREIFGSKFILKKYINPDETIGTQLVQNNNDVLVLIDKTNCNRKSVLEEINEFMSYI